MRALEDENARLKRLVADQAPNIQVMKDPLGRGAVTPAERRAVVTQAQARFGLRCGTACRYLGVHRALVRYASRSHEPPGLLARLRELALEKPRWGAPRLTWRRRHRKRVALVRVPSPTPMSTRPDDRWSMDFVRDTTTDGRPSRVWTFVDGCSRECPLALVDPSLLSRRVIEGLEALHLVRPLPATVVCDNGRSS